MSCVWYTRLLCRIWAGGRSGLNRLDRWRAVVCATRCEGDGVGGACVSHAHQYFTPESPSRRGTQLPFASCCLALCPQTQQQAPPRARLTTSILAPGYWRCMWCSPPQKPTHRRPGALTPPPPHSPPQVTSPTPPPPARLTHHEYPCVRVQGLHVVVRYLHLPGPEPPISIVLPPEGQVGTVKGEVKGAVSVQPVAEALRVCVMCVC